MTRICGSLRAAMRKCEIIDIRDRSLNIMMYSRRGWAASGTTSTRARQVIGMRNTLDPKRASDIINTYEITDIDSTHQSCKLSSPLSEPAGNGEETTGASCSAMAHAVRRNVCRA